MPNDETYQRWKRRARDIRENLEDDPPALRIRKLADVVMRVCEVLPTYPVLNPEDVERIDETA